MAYTRRPWARVTIYDEEGRILRRVKPRNWADEAAATPLEDNAALRSKQFEMENAGY